MKTIIWQGGKITEPGLYKGVPIDFYHGDCCDGPSISSTGLRALIHTSPAHFYAKSYLNPRRVEQKEKAHFSLGRAVHHLVLGEAYFAKLYAIQPEEYTDQKTGEKKKWTRAAEVCKSWHRAREKEGRTSISASDAENIVGMARSLAAHDTVKAGLLRGLIERSIFWRDEETGIWLKWRPDCVPNDSGDFSDLKTTTSVLWTDLMRTIDDYAYYQQGALGREVVKHVLGMDMQTFSLVFVEKNDPWCCRTVIIKEHLLQKGQSLNRIALRTMRDCLKSGRWPGPGAGGDVAEYIETSEWSQKHIDDIIQRLSADTK